LEIELRAIKESAAIFPLSDRGFLRITGADATRWLNGMVTNNIKDLAPGEGNYNFLLNNQGRIQGDCTIYRDSHTDRIEYILESDSSQIPAILELLDKFIIMDDVELAPVLYIQSLVSATEGICLLGKKAPEILLSSVLGEQEQRLTEPPAPGTFRRASANGSTLVVIAPPNVKIPTYEIWFESSTEEELVRATLFVRGAAALSDPGQEAYRVLSATPRYGQDIRNTEAAKDLPQETAQTHALHFSKGCYLGQEIVERIHSRGAVHRTFAQFRLTGEMPVVPTSLEANGKAVGELTSAVQIGQDMIALGYVRREALETRQTLSYSGGTAQPTSA